MKKPTSVFHHALRARAGATACLGVLLAAGLGTQLIGNDYRDSLLETPPEDQQDRSQPFRSSLLHPDLLGELLERTPRWQEAAQLAGTRWRVGWPEFDSPDAHGEQFVTSALGVETMVGHQGHVWPVRQETFVYGPPGARRLRSVPVEGRNPFCGSSALMRTSIAWPRISSAS